MKNPNYERENNVRDYADDILRSAIPGGIAPDVALVDGLADKIAAYLKENHLHLRIE